MKNNVLKTAAILMVLVVSTTEAAVFYADRTTDSKPCGGTSFTWEDDFLDESGIDIEKSYNYIVDKSKGIVVMKDTYEAWYNPAWTRMKPIEIENIGGTTFNEYVLDMTIYYDSDMQPDFCDLRFVDSEGNDLYYWIGEKTIGESANVLVRVPTVPPGETTIYMFYGDPDAEDESNFDMIFTWDDRTDPDLMISYKNYLEGAWDADVAYGKGRFLVAWEEGLGPEDLPDQMERLVSRRIHGRTYDEDGKNPYPDPQDDLDIYITPRDDTSYHAENPSIAFGGGKFFVAWEENIIMEGRYAVDIKGALVTPSGEVTKRFTICNAYLGQYDPCVAYDGSSKRFFVVWEDARDSSNNYDVYGRIYDVNANPIGGDFQVAAGANCQDEPWVCSDDQGYFMVVYEDGYHPVTGPFSLEAQRYDPDGNKVGSVIPIASGSSEVDHIFPCVSYCPKTERYFVAWNDGDISVDPTVRSSYDGNIWGKILDKYGNTVCDNFIVQPGSSYVRTDVVPYLGTLFFVSYDGGSDLWGILVSSDGRVQTDEHMLSDGSSLRVDWNNLAVSNGKIFAVWEDERDQASDYADAFGSVWHIYRSTGSSDVTYNVGDEKEIVTEAVVVSKIIKPGSGFKEWEEFYAWYTTPIGNIQFDILDEQGTQVLLGGINPGKDISSITEEAIRLRAIFTRTVPKDTPSLDKWCVSWIGSDYDPPWTDYEIIPSSPNGENGWYTVTVEFILYPHDDVSPPEDIITYYKINDGSQTIYDPNNRPRIYTERPDNKIEFWSVDAAGNEELPHNVIGDIKIDKSRPTVTIESPGWGTVPRGDVEVKATVYESSLGSGIEKVEIWFNGGKVKEFPEQDVYKWHFTAERWQQYDIEVWGYDYAGNIGKAYVSVRCPKSIFHEMMLRSITGILRNIANFLQEILTSGIPNTRL
jgi:hypothetical protein